MASTEDWTIKWIRPIIISRCQDSDIERINVDQLILILT